MGLRMEDWLRHFATDFVPVVEKHRAGVERKRSEAAELAREERERLLREQLIRSQIGENDAQRERALRPPEPPRGPDPYGGRTREQWLQDQTDVARGRAAANAAHRPPPKPERPRAAPQSDSPESISRVRASARGDLARWYSRNPEIPVERAVRYVRERHPKLTEGEAYDLAVTEQRQAKPKGFSAGAPPLGAPPPRERR